MKIGENRREKRKEIDNKGKEKSRKRRVKRQRDRVKFIKVLSRREIMPFNITKRKSHCISH